MPFFMVDDKLHVHLKTTALIENEGAAGAAALGLWTIGGSISQDKGSDGLLTPGDLLRLLLDKRLATKLAALLVKYRLWHAHGHECPKCPAVAPGQYLFHDWFAMGYDAGAKVVQTREIRKELKKPEIHDAVWLRDKGMCRYCGVQMHRKTSVGDRKPTLDHVIPGLPRGVTNLVLACLKCNQKKGQRTPEQAGMTLLPPPGDHDGPANTGDSATDHQPDHQPDHRGPGDGPEPETATPHKGRVRNRSGAGPGQGGGQGEPRVGPAGAAPDPGTPGRFGSPWANWTGPPGDPSVSVCPYHGLDLPCRKCAAATIGEPASFGGSA